jgi:hypothetical protein
MGSRPLYSKRPILTLHHRPLKWLRYLGSVIHGREGVLGTTREGMEIEDYSAIDVDSLLSDYFYYSLDERGRVANNFSNPASGAHQLANLQRKDTPRISDDSEPVSSHATFESGIAARDQTCVVTGMSREGCNAVHIIPHTKGDNVRLNSAHHYLLYSNNCWCSTLQVLFDREAPHNAI